MRNKKAFNLLRQTIKGCLSKTVYSNRYTAEIEAKKYNFKAYKCIHCDRFHLTSKKY